MPNVHSSPTNTAVSITTTAETTAAETSAFARNDASDADQGVVIRAAINIALSAAATAVVHKIYRVILGVATVINTQTVTATASTTVGHSLIYRDLASVVDPLLVPTLNNPAPTVSYRHTVTITSASGTSTINFATVTAEDANSFE